MKRHEEGFSAGLADSVMSPLRRKYCLGAAAELVMSRLSVSKGELWQSYHEFRQKYEAYG